MKSTISLENNLYKLSNTSLSITQKGRHIEKDDREKKLLYMKNWHKK